MRSLFCWILTAVFAAAQQAPGTEDVILKAMTQELERSRQLRLMGLVPYFIEYSIEDQESASVSASLGGILNARQSHVRAPFVSVRVGGYELDQTNQIYSGIFSGSRYDQDTLPLDDNGTLIRRTLWLATDRAYKSAVESMSAKQQILKNANGVEPLPDFTKSDPVVKILDFKRAAIDFEGWKSRSVKLSSVFLDFPDVLGSSAEFDAITSTSYHANSEGLRVRYPDNLTTMRIRAVGQAADGGVLRDAQVFHSFDPSRIASQADMEKAAREVAGNIKALVNAPIGENYSGPVLFEPLAAAQLFGVLLGDNVRNPRRPLSDPGRSVPYQPGELDGKIGSRILPDSFDVVDDPTQTVYEGHPLMGNYFLDIEGVTPKAVQVVEKGVLKEYIRTRQPIKGFTGSTGHARLLGNFGHKTATIGNLFVKSREAKPMADLKKQLIAMCQQRNKPYGILVKKLDYPTSASFQDLQAMVVSFMQSGATTRPLPLPVLLYRVYQDGREELIRNVRFKNVSTRSLRDILAASSETAVFDYINNNAPFALMGAPGYLAAASVIAPGILFDEIEIDKIQDQTVKPPVVPAPALR